MKPKLHFLGKRIGNLKTVQRILEDTGKYAITSQYYEMDQGMQFDPINETDYIITSHRCPERPTNKKIQRIHLSHGTGPISVGGFDVDDFICVCGKNFKDQYINVYSQPEEKILVIGMPYSIDFLKEGGREEFLSDRGQDPDKKTILYAPTWGHNEPRGFFALWFKRNEREKVETFCKYITKDLNCNLMIRFHEHFRYDKNWLHEEYQDIFRKYNIYARYYNEDIDDVPFIKHSDVLVGDMSSLNTCFYIADKPIVLIGTSVFKRKRKKYGGVTIEDRNSSSYVTDTFDEMLEMVKDSLEDPNRFKSERKAFVDKYIDYVGEASRQAVIDEFARAIGR